MYRPQPGTHRLRLHLGKHNYPSHNQNRGTENGVQLSKNPAWKLLYASGWRIRWRYRRAVLHSSIFSLHFEPDRTFLTWLEEKLSQMGQEVNSAISDVQLTVDDNDEFLSLSLNEACSSLSSLVISFLRCPNQSRLLEYSLNWLIGHWFHVCRMCLLRGWLGSASKCRLFFETSLSSQSLERLFVEHNHHVPLHTCCSFAKEASERGLQLMKHLSATHTNSTCHPVNAHKLYEGLRQLVFLKNGPDTLKQNSLHLLNQPLLILLEAQALSASRIMRHFRKCVQTILHTSPRRDAVAEGHNTNGGISSYQEHIDRCFTLAGMVTLCLLLGFLLVIHYLLTVLPERLRYLHFSVDSGDAKYSIQMCILTYCFVAPLCVFLNLQLRLYFAHFFVTHLPFCFTGSHNPTCLHTHSLSHAQIHKIRFAIYSIWHSFELHEFRLVQLYQQLCSQMRQRGIFVSSTSV